MSDIGVGDWVECIDASARRDGPPNWSHIAPPLIEGALYKVCALCSGIFGDPAVLLFGAPPALPTGDPRFPGIFGYRLTRFGPLRDGQERITRKATKRQCEPA